MKDLMIDVVNHCYDFLTTLCSPFGDTIVEHLKQHDLLSPQSVQAQRWLDKPAAEGIPRTRARSLSDSRPASPRPIVPIPNAWFRRKVRQVWVGG
jgi:hypothetical protein